MKLSVLFLLAASAALAQNTFQNMTVNGGNINPDSAQKTGGYLRFTPIINAPNDGPPCYDSFHNPVQVPVAVPGAKVFGENDLLLWNSLSPSQPPTGCGKPLKINIDYGINTNGYFFAQAGFATDKTDYNSIQTYTGGMTANSYTAGGVYPNGTTICTSSPAGVCLSTVVLNSPYGAAYLGGHIDTGHSDGPPSPGTISQVTNPFSTNEGLVAGMIYYDDAIGCERVYSGTDWSCMGGGGGGTGSPGAPVNAIQYNAGGGVFGGSAALTWNTFTNTLTINGVGGSSGVIAPVFNAAGKGGSPEFQGSQASIYGDGTFDSNGWIRLAERTPPPAGLNGPNIGNDLLYADSATHQFMMSLNGGSWIPLGGGSGTAGLPVLSVQFNTGPGTLTGSANFKWDNVGQILVICNPPGTGCDSNSGIEATTFSSSALAANPAFETNAGGSGTSHINGDGTAYFQTTAVGIHGSAITGLAGNATLSATTAGLFVSLNAQPPVQIGGTPGAPANSVQFNTGSGFGGSPNLTWSGTPGTSGSVGTLAVNGAGSQMTAPLFNISGSPGGSAIEFQSSGATIRADGSFNTLGWIRLAQRAAPPAGSANTGSAVLYADSTTHQLMVSYTNDTSYVPLGGGGSGGAAGSATQVQFNVGGVSGAGGVLGASANMAWDNGGYILSICQPPATGCTLTSGIHSPVFSSSAAAGDSAFVTNGGGPGTSHINGSGNAYFQNMAVGIHGTPTSGDGGAAANAMLSATATGLYVSFAGATPVLIAGTTGGSGVTSLTSGGNGLTFSASTGNVTANLAQDIRTTASPSFAAITVGSCTGCGSLTVGAPAGGVQFNNGLTPAGLAGNSNFTWTNATGTLTVTAGGGMVASTFTGKGGGTGAYPFQTNGNTWQVDLNGNTSQLGNLLINNTTGGTAAVDGPNGTYRGVSYYTAIGSNPFASANIRWYQGEYPDPESGTNTGSTWVLNDYDNSGNLITSPIIVYRADNRVRMPGGWYAGTTNQAGVDPLGNLTVTSCAGCSTGGAAGTDRQVQFNDSSGTPANKFGASANLVYTATGVLLVNPGTWAPGTGVWANTVLGVGNGGMAAFQNSGPTPSFVVDSAGNEQLFGQLQIGTPPASGGAGGTINIIGNRGTYRDINWASADGPSGTGRWILGVDNSAESTGTNNGSNMFINAYADNGAYLSQPLAITRSSGLVTMANSVSVGVILGVHNQIQLFDQTTARPWTFFSNGDVMAFRNYASNDILTLTAVGGMVKAPFGLTAQGSGLIYNGAVTAGVAAVAEQNGQFVINGDGKAFFHNVCVNGTPSTEACTYGWVGSTGAITAGAITVSSCTGCTTASGVTSLTSSGNGITFSASTGAITASLAQDIRTIANVTFNQVSSTTGFNSSATGATGAFYQVSQFFQINGNGHGYFQSLCTYNGSPSGDSCNGSTPGTGSITGTGVSGLTVGGDFRSNVSGYGIHEQDTFGSCNIGMIYGLGGIGCSSDLRLKENVKPLADSLDLVMKLRPVTFNWKKNHETSTGFIAQEVQAVLPELVHLEADGFYSLSASGMIPELVKSIQQLKGQVDALQTKLAAAQAK